MPDLIPPRADHRRVRGVRRPQPPEDHPRPLQPGAGRAPARALRHRRLRPRPLAHAGVRRLRPRGRWPPSRGRRSRRRPSTASRANLHYVAATSRPRVPLAPLEARLAAFDASLGERGPPAPLLRDPRLDRADARRPARRVGAERRPTGWCSRSRSAATWRRRASSTPPSTRSIDESQVFRIDHFLGKETIQNLLVLRFANAMFGRVWNRDTVDHVQITAAETVGVEQRGAFYEETGAVRDMIQNHLLQLLAFVAMEAPRTFSPDDIRDETVRVLRAVRPFRPEESLRGQYVRGEIGGRRWPATARRPTSTPSRRWRPSSPSGPSSTTGGGPASPSTSRPASASRARAPRWRWCSRRSRRRSSPASA